MHFTGTKLPGAYLIDLETQSDDRGFFARSFCQEEFAARGLKTDVRQCNVSFNKTRGTLRGMHFQHQPKSEAKLVRCTRGAMYDVIIDLRPDSLTYCQWVGVGLTEGNHRALYVPEGFAHGFQTLTDNTEVFYQMFEDFSPGHADGLRWDDPVFSIAWPLSDPIMSDKDRSYSRFAEPAR